MGKRIVRDSFGEMEVPQEALYGAQTARSLIHFNIGRDRMPPALIRAYGVLKEACAEANCHLNFLPKEFLSPIVEAAREVAAGKWMEHFPLSIWQTGSGTQTNMNVNEVIATRAAAIGGIAVHPNDHVNCSQSTNDSFPTAMHIAAAQELKGRLLPMVHKLTEALHEKGKEFSGIIKVGRTHLMDATPITLEQEFSGYVTQLTDAKVRLEDALAQLYPLAIGGTAVGTGLNTPPGFVDAVIQNVRKLTALPFTSAPNKFAALAAHDALLHAHSALKTLATGLMKIASDLAWMVSGPRAGIGELTFPPNEPGSSIMPGKVNPTQCEALLMVCVQVIGHDVAMSAANGMGQFELNVFKPLLIHNFLHSLELLADACRAFTNYFVVGLSPNREQIATYLNRSLMLVTALNPVIGYDKAAEVAKKAYAEAISLKEAAVALDYLSAEEFERVVDPGKMV